MQHSLIRELRFYDIEQGHNVAEIIKSISCTKGKDSSETRWLKEFHSSFKYFNDRQGQVGLKTEDSEIVLPVIKTNLASKPRRVSDNLSISQCSMVRQLDFSKTFRRSNYASRTTKILQNF